ncbi:FMN-dependent oxidoreductase (nitrilotriacetate monooxygenase family) [Arthrobacter ginsengisoli]|uniref:FMN-dependent oxidoreductase (Nitrilotriacetate monooxygenase family) n=1 Tax=Arthrobacter ginsengisoli TaxID=1356565 RepID=A0ABU1UI23_9MICC|nr:LLM class flavin-dependent oxidoreductase [Arthrobacter ginsengisoli]MDR7084791.1 FMN-dependent oxidoreductase (nitrilotriacetate monooxygenase family) [Arthrobacter ginsengisoli]
MANKQNSKKRMILNAFDMNCVGHQNPGMWAHPDDQTHRYKDVEYWTDLAKLLERGGFDCLFIADVLGFYDVYGGSRDTALRTAAQAPVGDPAIPVSAMAAVTERLGFGVTKSLTYELPYSFAKTMTTLDHITKGRVAWNIVTSYQASAAENLGLDKQIPHDERYAVADEFMEVCYKLWEGSWEEDAVVFDKEKRIFTDPSKVHDINHEGKYYKVPGAHLGQPSPQRTPFLFQAGTSKKGMEFSGKHAEAVFVIGTSPEELRPTVEKVRQQAAEAGRDPRSVKVIVMLTPITAPTDEEAQAKLEDFYKYADTDAALTLFGGWTGIDMSSAPADQPLENIESDAIRAMIDMLTGVDSEVVWTKERLAKWLCIGGFSASVVGSPTTIVDEMERWMEIADVDGFNLGRVIAPGTMEDFVELVVPELRKRGHVPQDPAAEGVMTLRERLTGDSRLPSEHAGANYRLGVAASVS